MITCNLRTRIRCYHENFTKSRKKYLAHLDHELDWSLEDINDSAPLGWHLRLNHMYGKYGVPLHSTSATFAYFSRPLSKGSILRRFCADWRFRWESWISWTTLWTSFEFGGDKPVSMLRRKRPFEILKGLADKFFWIRHRWFENTIVGEENQSRCQRGILCCCTRLARMLGGLQGRLLNLPHRPVRRR